MTEGFRMLKWFSKSAWTYDAQTGEEAEQTVTAALEDGKSALTLRPEKYLNIQSASLTIGSGGVTLAQGGAIRNQCVLYFDRDPEAAGENVFAGTVTISGQRGRVEVNDGLTIASTGSVVSSAEHRNFGFEVYGGLTVEAGGLVESSATRTVISGKSYNYGTIKVASGTLYLQNTGYSVYNMGEISVSGGAVLNAAGTVVVNTGSMTGSGTLQLGELDDITDYDNGIEYVELGLDWSDRTPASYDRYQFVRDPAATVEVVYFIGALSNQDGGACGLTVQE